MRLVRALPQHMHQGFLNQIFGKMLVTADETIEIAEEWGMVAAHQRG